MTTFLIVFIINIKTWVHANDNVFLYLLFHGNIIADIKQLLLYNIIVILRIDNNTKQLGFKFLVIVTYTSILPQFTKY